MCQDTKQCKKYFGVFCAVQSLSGSLQMAFCPSPPLYLTAGPKTFLAISGHHSGQLNLMTSFRDLSTSESPGIVSAIVKSPQT